MTSRPPQLEGRPTPWLLEVGGDPLLSITSRVTSVRSFSNAALGEI